MKPKLIIYDFDGVMTDNKVIVNQNGTELVICNRDDGWGVRMIRDVLKIPQCILSSESNYVVIKRARKLGIPAIIDKIDKLRAFRNLIGEKEVRPTEVIFIGNGLNDLGIMKEISYPMCPADAHPEIQKICCEVFKAKGGDGVVLELYELLLNWEGI